MYCFSYLIYLAASSPYNMISSKSIANLYPNVIWQPVCLITAKRKMYCYSRMKMIPESKKKKLNHFHPFNQEKPGKGTSFLPFLSQTMHCL